MQGFTYYLCYCYKQEQNDGYDEEDYLDVACAAGVSDRI